MSRKIIATSALPYANGAIHLGHILEHLAMDYWIRFQKLKGNAAFYFCADDTHGTPVMLKAREMGMSPEDWVKKCQAEHLRDFKDFEIQFDHYSTTHSSENRRLAETIYLGAKKNNNIATKTIQQLFCENDKMFLPDRFVRGTCPKCASENQYGDACDNCGSTYSPKDLIKPQCSVCGTTPVDRESEHVFFKLGDFQEFLKEWVPQHTPKEISNKMNEWLSEPLRNWDISRDEPYFGFLIPGYSDKYFYVWVDAPIGYISTLSEWAISQGKKYEDFWENEEFEIYHNIGKDIVYFHCLFWPAMLRSAGFRTPNEIIVHGFLNVNGEKMSKSKGTFINARTYLNNLNPLFLRYYLASKMSGSVSDLDINFEDFTSRVNSELIGKITNLGSRSLQMIAKRFDSTLGKILDDDKKKLLEWQRQVDDLAKLYDARDFAKVIVGIREIAESANQYFDSKAPWKGTEATRLSDLSCLTTVANLFRWLAVALSPILPSYSEKALALYGKSQPKWTDLKDIIEEQQVKAYTHLIQRIEPERIQAMIEEQKREYEASLEKATPAAPVKAATETQTEGAMITIDDFMKVDLRVARIAEASLVEGADKLLRLKLDLGPLGERQVFAGIRAAYEPEKLVGRHTIVVANLAPRKMKFGMSEGMVLAAGDGGADLYIFSPDSGAKAGQRVK
ncbi:MAG: methionine--tRNA ligase [Bdellovibrionales bacterium CG10_big_fil_rev_8_21_14_0_10_45_34]|nr:MAG: methionine--tRNA ligase [Bdellovibrionales bacterium CG10_big_fil_rev_8_21_14_0_10_45_34]